MWNAFYILNLTTAGILVGWFGATISIFSITVFGLCFINLNFLTEIIAEEMHQPDITPAVVRDKFITIIGVYFTMSCLKLITSILLLIGIVRKRPMFLMPWLINASISLCISTVYYFGFIYFVIKIHTPGLYLIVALITIAMPLALHCYIWLVVFALLQELQSEQYQRQHQRLLKGGHNKT